MSFIEKLEEVAGAVVAVEAAKKLDPNAGIFTEGAAAYAGYKGVETVQEHSDPKPQSEEQTQPE